MTTTTQHHKLTAPNLEKFGGYRDDKEDEIPSQGDLVCLEAIMGDPIVADIPEAERHEAISDAFELYLKTKETIAPVVAGFADELLREAEGGKQIVFAARDGLSPYMAACGLLEKFPGHYKMPENNLSYAYFTRKLLGNSSRDEIEEYVASIGIDTAKPMIVADIGMYGSIQYDLQRVFSDFALNYLISRNPQIPGFIDDGEGRHLESLRDGIIGNPVVHFLEDTFSGRTSSPARLIRHEGRLVPDLTEDAYEPKELLKRSYAISSYVTNNHAAINKHRPSVSHGRVRKKTYRTVYGNYWLAIRRTADTNARKVIVYGYQ